MKQANDLLLRISVNNMKEITKNGEALSFLIREEDGKITNYNIVEEESQMERYDNPLLGEVPLEVMGKRVGDNRIFLVALDMGSLMFDKYKLVVSESEEDAVKIYQGMPKGDYPVLEIGEQFAMTTKIVGEVFL